MAEHALADVRLVAPIPRPPSIRDFYAFERHVQSARAQRGLEMALEWYQLPVFYFSNPASVIGPEASLLPGGELGVGLRARGGRRCRRRGPDRRLHGYERLVGARPPEDGDGGRPRACEGQGLRHEPRPGSRDAGRAGRPRPRDGCPRERRGALPGKHGRDPLALGRARRARRRGTRASLPGDILGSGTVGTGCILEHADGRWLQSGDVVELEIEGIGVLRNVVGDRPASGTQS